MSSMAVIGDYWGRKRHLHRTGSECRCSQARRCACIAPCKQPKSQLKQDWMRGVLASAVPQGSAHVYFLGTRFEPNERPVDKSRRLW
jgi:hypothetical protein